MKKYCLKYANNDNYIKFIENADGKIAFASCQKQEAAIFNLFSEAEQKRKSMEEIYKNLKFNDKFVIEEIEVVIL